ncbi:uncharacterized protein LOC129583537 [Paramacrobiotus metropolitanus]|uniref:uncharacterized protein LOC129583537 n=1 Tax=Paramacrobiotus metropolitanus TaxID=2943436 RepID=UPI002445B894|nr:uncharacterized protein LOC129583537 [Paramacrobiotus metropolitanus]
MPKPLSQDAVDIIRYMAEENKLDCATIAALIGKQRSFIQRILKRVDPLTGELTVAKAGRHQKTSESENDRIRQMALQNPYIGCEALTSMYNELVAPPDRRISKSSIHRRLKSVGIKVVKISAADPELHKFKQFPNSKHIWKFETINKKNRASRRQPEVEQIEMDTVESISIEFPQLVYPTFALPMPTSIVPPEIAECQDTDNIEIFVYPPGRPAIQLQ